MSHKALYSRLLGRALLRPHLLLLLIRVGWRFRRRDWFRRWPFLPLPPRKYLEWRMHTAFGSRDYQPSSKQLEDYLRWTRSMGRH